MLSAERQELRDLLVRGHGKLDGPSDTNYKHMDRTWDAIFWLTAWPVVAAACSNTKKSGELLVMNAQFGEGFWYFSGYCIFTVIASYLIKPQTKLQNTP
jgi:hypothetical protein